jgi:hypothetical protein
MRQPSRWWVRPRVAGMTRTAGACRGSHGVRTWSSSPSPRQGTCRGVGFASVASQTPSRSSELGVNLASSESQSQPQALSGRLLRLPLEGSASTVSEEATSNRVRPGRVRSRVFNLNGRARGAGFRCSLTVPRVTVSMIRVLCVLTLAPPSPYPSGPQGLLEMQLPISGPGRFGRASGRRTPPPGAH